MVFFKFPFHYNSKKSDTMFYSHYSFFRINIKCNLTWLSSTSLQKLIVHSKDSRILIVLISSKPDWCCNVHRITLKFVIKRLTANTIARSYNYMWVLSGSISWQEGLSSEEIICKHRVRTLTLDHHLTI